MIFVQRVYSGCFLQQFVLKHLYHVSEGYPTLFGTLPEGNRHCRHRSILFAPRRRLTCIKEGIRFGTIPLLEFGFSETIVGLLFPTKPAEIQSSISVAYLGSTKKNKAMLTNKRLGTMP